MKLFQRICGLLMAAAVAVSLVPPAWAAGESSSAGDRQETTVLFTHDLHSHFMPQATEDGGESGGYARLMTALKRERAKHPNALTVDGGDVSIGSLIQTLYTTEAAELRTMGAMGYDATTMGNHEFDHTGLGFAKMLNAAVLSGDRVPAMVMSNYRPAQGNPYQLDIQRAMSAYGVKDYILLERGGVTYGIFGLMGEESDAMAPTSYFDLEDMVDNAQRCVDELEEQGAEFIICLSHSGTNPKKSLSEDEKVAEKVEGIDLLVSGHTHTTLTEPIVAGDTYIVSAGPYCRNLGSITLSWDTATGAKELEDYHLVPIDETLPDDPGIASMVEDWKTKVSASYLSRYDMTYDQVLTRAPFDLKQPAHGVQKGNNLGELISDSYMWTVENLEKDAPDVPTVAVVAAGVIRAPIPAGPITVADAFDVLSMGVGSDGTSGFPLVGCYLTGKELKAAVEVDASITPIMPVAQLYFSGLQYRFNTHRMFFDRVISAELIKPGYVGDPSLRIPTEIKDDQLYRIVTSMYTAQMLGTVKSRSFGLLALEPKMADGTPVSDFNDCILRDRGGNEIKEWTALAYYLEDMGEDGIPDHYANPDGRKDVSRSLNPFELLKNPSWITFAALAVLILGTCLAVFLMRMFLHFRRESRYSGRRKFLFFGR